MSESTSESQAPEQTADTPAVGALLQEAAPPADASAAPADAAAPEQTGAEGEQKTDDSTDEQKPADGAPEAYEAFTAPEGVVLADNVLEVAQQAFKDANLSQEKAQSLIDKLTPAIAQAQQEALDAAIQSQITDWVAAAKADEQIGGDKLAPALANANRVVDTFGSPELRDMLISSGLGNHPAVIKFCDAIFSKISPDTFVAAAPRPGGKQSFYPNSNMN